ncbi:MAG: ABC transporter ATP-binding protein [Acidobacteria bacterium]|nr:ABC transporter ATP-binding protein [Acidobacteriota bacterium]
MSDVHLKNISRSYDGGVRAVSGVTLDVPDGEILTVLGPSGCGKSTLLRLVAGLDRPDSGEITIGGEDVTGREPKDRDVAMVFQSYALYPHMKIFENIAVALRLRRLPREEVGCRVAKAAEMLGISGLLGRYPRQLSGGERQRAALARAIVRDPKAFLLDEPLSNLDALQRERTRAELKTLFKEIRATVLYVTHDQIEAMTLSDQMAVMRSGQIEQVGKPEEIYARPTTFFVAGFVGSPQMNLLPGDLFPGGAHTVGIRPEDILLAPEGPMEMGVVLRESLGSQVLLSLRGGGLELKALVPAGRPAAENERVRLDPARAHFFSADGRRIDSPSISSSAVTRKGRDGH